MTRVVAAALLVVAATVSRAQSVHGQEETATGQSCVGGASAPLGPEAAEASTPFERKDVRAIAERITCYCGCPHLQVSKCFCGTADRIRADIAAQIDTGHDPESIVAAYIAEHGTWSLAAPPRSGFNWVAWLAGPIALTLGGLFVFVAGRAWARRAPAPAAVPEPMDEATTTRLRAELHAGTD